MIIIQTAFSTYPSIIMSDPDALKSLFEDPLDLEMDNLTKPNPNPILRLKQLIWSLQSTRCQQFPIIALPIDPQPTPMVPTVVSIAIAPIIPTDPLFPPCLRPQRPYHLGEDITEVRRGTCFIRVEEWDNDHYWITVMSYNTPVTLLTNFQLVPGHPVTSIHIPRFLALMFHARTWMQPHDPIYCHPARIVFRITEALHLWPYLLFIV